MTDQSQLMRDALHAIERLQAQVDAADRARHEPIAILGIGCRYPGGVMDPEGLWDLVSDGVDAVTDVPADRWDKSLHHDPRPNTPGKMLSMRGGFIRDIDLFDASYFGITPREARWIDPQQRMLLETTVEAVERAGMSTAALAGRQVAVFIGATSTEYATVMQALPLEQSDIYSINGGGLHGAAGRVSFTFGLVGPCLTLDTACSSSLAAIHLACQSLRSGESEMALAGGANLILEPRGAIVFSAGGVMSADGKCKPFDAGSDGFVRAEGCGVILLKRLSDATRDGDPIIGVIRGSAVNSDGRSAGLTQPYGPAQEALVRTALADAQLAPADIDYVEAHGTGTPIGDPIEAEALANVLSEGRPASRPLIIGSVKSNIGHPEAASGLAGLIKGVMALAHEAIPPTLHQSEPNPHIAWDQLPIRVARETLPWPREAGRPRRLGVSSFGFSGTNAHVIVEEAPIAAPAATPPVRVPDAAALIPLSARGPQALKALAARHAAWLGDHPHTPLADIALTLGAGRDHHSNRLGIVADDTASLVESLRAVAAGDMPASAAAGTARRGDCGGVAFVFTGQGAQYPGMGRDLYDREPVFRAMLDRAATVLAPVLDRPLLDVMFADDGDGAIHQTAYTQPALFALECALAALWRSWGIEPTVVLGHSVGEFSAACVAGAIAFDDGLRLLAERGRLMQALPAGGAMSALFVDEARARAAIAGQDHLLAVATINGPGETVVSGDGAAIATLVSALAAQGIEARPLEVSHAFHSPLLDPMLDAFEACAAGIAYGPIAIPLISNVTGKPFADGERPDAAYWRRHARQAVRFADSIATLADMDIGAIVEIGPHPTLLALIARALPDEPWLKLPSLRRGRDDARQMIAATRDLYVKGFALDWTNLPVARDGRRFELPTYAFQRSRHWFRDTTVPERRRAAGDGHPLLGERLHTPGPDIGFLAEVATDTPGFIADHVVFDAVLMPAAAYVDMFFSAARAMRMKQAIAIENMVIETPLDLIDGETTRLHTALTPDGRNGYDVVIRSAPFSDDGGAIDEWTVHARARISAAGADAAHAAPDYDALESLPARDSQAFYDDVRKLGLTFGPAFRVLGELAADAVEGRGLLTLPAGQSGARHAMHPVLIDAALQLSGTVWRERLAVPLAFDRIVLHRAPEDVMRGTVHLLEVPVPDQSGDSGLARADTRIETLDGEPVLTIHGSIAQVVTPEALRRSRRPLSFAVDWTEIDAGGRDLAGQAFVLLGGNQSMVDAIAGAGGKATLASTIADLNIVGQAMVVDLQALTPDVADHSHPDRASHRYLAALATVQALPIGAGLTLVTRGAQAIAPGDEIALDAAPLVGLLRSIDAEQPYAPRRRIDLDPGGTIDARQLVAALIAGGEHPEIAVRQGSLLVPRLQRSMPSARTLEETTRSVLTIVDRGDLDGLFFDEVPRVAPGRGEVEIEVRASGLNFRDVLNALGMYPAPVPPLGSECAGIITAVGPGVDDLAIGDEVVAIALESFASHVTLATHMVVRKPASITFAQAVTIPNAYLTALLCLKIADLKPGQRVLVHAAAGGVGSAAVKLARHMGLEVFATAGSAEKRAFATAQGATHVFGSRTTDFADEILAKTNGEGVDLVINSLAADFIAAGMRIVRPDGAFVEIGKQGVWTVEEAAERAPGVRYSVEDLGADIARDPEAVRRDLDLIMNLIDRGAIDPLPLRVFPLSSAKQAFRYMANASHIGKVVLAPDRWGPALAIRADGTYMVTGGLGGVGFETVKWLSARGAGHIVVTGRREPDAGQRAAIAALHAPVTTIAADVSDEAALAALWAGPLAALPPLRGIVHAAGVLADTPIEEQDAAHWETVARPKMVGGWNLHALSMRDPLDFFVVFSSTSALFGSAGQVNYSSANAWLDGLASYRRLHGRPATSIAWGPWAQVGMAAAMDAQHALWSRGGLNLITPAHGIEALERALGSPGGYAAISALDVRRFASVSRGIAAALLDTRADNATPLTDPAGGPTVLEALAAAGDDPAARLAVMVAFVHGEVARVLGFSPAALDPTASLVELGLDSLMAVQLRNVMMGRLATDLPVRALLNGLTVEQLATVLLTTLDGGTDDQDLPTTPEDGTMWEEGAL